MSKNSTSGLKQVIVMRNDLNMRKGKMIAQGSHASRMFMIYRLLNAWRSKEDVARHEEWMTKGMTKITVRVDSEAELLEIEQKAKDANLEVYLITDAGHTEFKGVPTKTCLAIGPNDVDEIDVVTGHLKLL
jgi:peptidyl-tRNA hydrolase, PTH2 family